MTLRMGIEMLWKDILKLRPSQDYGQDPRPKDKAADGYAETKDSISGNTAIIFMPHYMKSMKDRKIQTSKVISPEIEQKYASLSVGDYWHYLNSSVGDRSYLMIKVMTQGNLPRTSTKVSSLMNKDQERYEKVIALTHINDGHNYNPNYKKLDIYFTGIKRGHRPKQKGGRREEPFNPFTMGRR